MESTELHDLDFFSSFSEHTNPTLFTPTTSSLRPDPVSEDPGSPTAQNEDEEDAYVAELTRQMANYMLQDDEKHQKSCGGGCGSPQSTLWSPFASGYSTPIGPSREPSPPLTPATTVETKPVMIPFQSKQALIDNQIRSVQANIQKAKEKQRNDSVVSAYKARNYHHQQRPRSGVKPAFVYGSGSRTGSGGTGVFLPRGHGTVVESRKKSGCSTVIIPARVVEALKVHFDKIGVPSTFSSDIPPFLDALLVSMRNKDNTNNKGSSSTRAQSGPPCMAKASAAESHQEPPADLPQEWTY